jgi:cytochrome P450 PksS
MIALLLFAGYETTVGLIACGALALMENREQRDLWLARPEIGETAVEELLRYTSPADFSTPRTARETVTIAGVAIPKGAMVLAGLGSANRDEMRFPDPDRLDLTRDGARHLAFGMGIHFCVGAPLARLEARIALPALFRRFPALRAEAGRLRWRRGMLFRGLEELPVAW